MQSIERFLGFRIEADKYLPPSRLASLEERARLIAERYQLDPEDHHVYIHSLSFIPSPKAFMKGTNLPDRVESVVIGFHVNQKQEVSKKLRLVNHLFRDVLEPSHQYATNHMVHYTILGHELEHMGTFRNELITFVHRSLPVKHRKIKIAVMARPSESSSLKRKRRVVTKLDLRYENYTPFQLPSRRSSSLPTAKSVPIAWRGPGYSEELQSFLQEEQLFISLSDCRNAVDRSLAVCRVEIPAGVHSGTGVLIGHKFVLTNFHVLERSQPGLVNVRQIASKITLRFGSFINQDGSETQGIEVPLDSCNPIAASSTTKELDFVLLRLGESLPDQFVPVPYDLTDLKVNDTLHILQYPILDPQTPDMKFATKPNSVTGIYPEVGRVQYITIAARGSSGSPCFNKDWKMVALHHSEKHVSFGSRREGILFSAIYELIQKPMEELNA